MTVVSGDPLPVTDQTAKTALYFTPFTSNEIGLYDGAGWVGLSFSEASVSVSGVSADQIFDVFGYLSGGALALELVNWNRPTGSITGATSAAAPTTVPPSDITITSNAHGLVNGNLVRVTGVGGQTGANGLWYVINATTNTFDLHRSDKNNGLTYTSGGTWVQVNPTRATSLVRQDGILSKSGDTTRRYLGTCRIGETAGQTEDSKSKRFVFNMYNRVQRLVSYLDNYLYSGNNYYDFSPATSYWRQQGNTQSNRSQWVIGQDDVYVELTYHTSSENSASVARFSGVRLDGVGGPTSIQAVNSSPSQLGTDVTYRGYPLTGYHWVNGVELSNPSAAPNETRWYAANESGVAGTIVM